MEVELDDLPSSQLAVPIYSIAQLLSIPTNLRVDINVETGCECVEEYRRSGVNTHQGLHTGLFSYYPSKGSEVWQLTVVSGEVWRADTNHPMHKIHKCNTLFDPKDNL